MLKFIKNKVKNYIDYRVAVEMEKYVSRDAEAESPTAAAVSETGRFDFSRLQNDKIQFIDAAIGSLVVIKTDVGISQTILSDGVWAEDDCNIFRKLVKSGDVVFDVGANIGHHSVLFSHLVSGSGKVYAFEPQDFIYKVLCTNLLLNDADNCFPVKNAVGDKNCFIRMYPIDYDTPNNFGALGISYKEQFEQGELVELITLDEFVKKNCIEKIDFMKIDVQTFELYAMKGSRNILETIRPAVFIEISPYWFQYCNNYDFTEIYEFLRGMNYMLLDKNLREIKPIQIREDEIENYKNIEWDVIAIPQEKLDEYEIVLNEGLKTEARAIEI